MKSEKSIKKFKKERYSGILMHISSLPGPYGIGSMGKEARKFAEFLDLSGQKYWQMLPVGPTGYGDSPYQSFSTYAGNSYFINLDELKKLDLLTDEELWPLNENVDPRKVNYERLYFERSNILELAFSRFNVEDEEFKEFIKSNEFWLKDYALFMSLKKFHENKFWLEWDTKYKTRDKESLDSYFENNKNDIYYYYFEQFIFFSQWNELKTYIHSFGIETIGDLPIYVAMDSADTWANPELFKLDKNSNPKFVGGAPPDAFTEEGQLWGNPVYNWTEHEKTNFQWWIDRIKWNLKIFDVLRLDHFIGFYRYWEIKYGDKNAVKGKWAKSPGIKLFNAAKEKLGELPIIAEDLGLMTEEIHKFRDETGFPGMKLLQFAFAPYGDSEYLPHNLTENTVIYTGTHDNDTIIGWFENANTDEIEFAIKYLNLTEKESYNWGFIRGAMTSVSRISIFQMQDFLFLDNSARMNVPGTLGDNWTWRMEENQIYEELPILLRKMTIMSGRLNDK